MKIFATDENLGKIQKGLGIKMSKNGLKIQFEICRYRGISVQSKMHFSDMLSTNKGRKWTYYFSAVSFCLARHFLYLSLFLSKKGSETKSLNTMKKMAWISNQFAAKSYFNFLAENCPEIDKSTFWNYGYLCSGI